MNAAAYNGHSFQSVVLWDIRLILDYYNDRLKLVDCYNASEDRVQYCVSHARKLGLDKVIAFCPIRMLKVFRKCGFVIEGIINGYFKGEDAYCVSYYIDRSRSISHRKQEEDAIVDQCVNTLYSKSVFQHRVKLRNAEKKDIPEMIKLFSAVFETYPTPVFSADYLSEVMDDHVLFKVAEDEGKIISVASADMDKANLNAEITDCATYPEYRGLGALSQLASSIETDLRKQGFYTLYSLSRAISPGINKALCRLGYSYSGRMINNCHICGGFEDMNIWVKRLKL